MGTVPRLWETFQVLKAQDGEIVVIADFLRHSERVYCRRGSQIEGIRAQTQQAATDLIEVTWSLGVDDASCKVPAVWWKIS